MKNKAAEKLIIKFFDCQYHKISVFLERMSIVLYIIKLWKLLWWDIRSLDQLFYLI